VRHILPCVPAGRTDLNRLNFPICSGHAGKHAAEWCGQNFHEFLLDGIITRPDTAVPDLLNQTFHAVDARLSKLAEEDRTHSGCTAVTAFLRVEEDDGDDGNGSTPAKGFVNPGIKSRGLLEGKGIEELEKLTASNRTDGSGSTTVGGAAGAGANPDESISSGGATVQRRSSRKMIKDFVKGLTGSNEETSPTETYETVPDATGAPKEGSMPIADGHHMVELIEPKSSKSLRRVLYTANVGDARAVLW
jgi:protein phosphatase PTC1